MIRYRHKIKNQVFLGENPQGENITPEQAKKIRDYYSENTAPADVIIKYIEKQFRSGKIGIYDDGTIEPLDDLYEQSSSGADFKFPGDLEADRNARHTCPYCQTSYREYEQKDADRCPFCHRLL